MTDAVISTKPYLLRALYEWCTDNGFTPYIAVQVDGSVQVPMEYVRNGEIVLNISFDATHGLRIDNDAVHFKARFGGIAREVYIPIERIAAIYARENGQGMAFPVETVSTAAASNAAPAPAGDYRQTPAAAHDNNPSVVTPLRPASSLSTAAETDDQAPPSSPSGENPPPPRRGSGGPSRLTRVK